MEKKKTVVFMLRLKLCPEFGEEKKLQKLGYFD